MCSSPNGHRGTRGPYSIRLLTECCLSSGHKTGSMGDAMEARLRKELLDGTPLPPCWSAVSRASGRVEYINDITGERQYIHPAEEYIRSRLNTAEDDVSRTLDQVVEPMSSISSLEDHSRVGHDEARQQETPWHPPVPTAAGEDDSKLRMVEPWRQALEVAYSRLSVRPTARGPHETEVPEQLKFTSWWAEETVANGMLVKRVDITFVVAKSEFRVSFHGSSDVVSVSHVLGKYGPINEYDLHVGATLKLLGRSITLKQADRPTTQWLERERKRLKGVRDRLASELSKYEVAYERLHHLYAKQEAVHQPRGTKGQLGIVPLRRYKTEVSELYNHLRDIRPKLAAKLEEEMGL